MNIIIVMTTKIMKNALKSLLPFVIVLSYISFLLSVVIFQWLRSPVPTPLVAFL